MSIIILKKKNRTKQRNEETAVHKCLCIPFRSKIILSDRKGSANDDRLKLPIKVLLFRFK